MASLFYLAEERRVKLTSFTPTSAAVWTKNLNLTEVTQRKKQKLMHFFFLNKNKLMKKLQLAKGTVCNVQAQTEKCGRNMTFKLLLINYDDILQTKWLEAVLC